MHTWASRGFIEKELNHRVPTPVGGTEARLSNWFIHRACSATETQQSASVLSLPVHDDIPLLRIHLIGISMLMMVQ